MSVYAPQTKSINFVKGTAIGSAIGSMKNTDWKRHIISLVQIQKSKKKSGTTFWKCASRKLLCMTESSQRDFLATGRYKKCICIMEKEEVA